MEDRQTMIAEFMEAVNHDPLTGTKPNVFDNRDDAFVHGALMCLMAHRAHGRALLGQIMGGDLSAMDSSTADGVVDFTPEEAEAVLRVFDSSH